MINNNKRHLAMAIRAINTLAISAATLAFAPNVLAQEEGLDQLEEVVVTGIRAALAGALDQKRDANNLVEVIQAEDIGKLPDQNLAEVLENIPGVQITRTAGVGTGVQIRGTSSNRTEINGVSTVGSGAGRTGIAFEDVSASMIAAVEVVKAPQAKTIEGSVGGTINLRTIRPLELKEMLAAVRVQGEDSSLSTDGIKPRLSGTWGDMWETDAGEFGVVVSASYAESDVTAFRPRADRDNLVTSDGGAASAQSFDFLPIQFFVQDYDNLEFKTTNFAGSFEWAPNENVKLYFDTVLNDQERLQESSRVQASGVSRLINESIPTDFETVDFGSLDGQHIGTIQAATKGIIQTTADGRYPNLRMSTDTGSRKTDSQIFRLGTDWNKDRFSGRVEVSTSSSDTLNPTFDTTINFLNPNEPLNSSNENGTPFQYDLTGNSLAFGIASGEANAPSKAQLLDPANYILRDVNQAQDKVENREDAFKVDFSYDLTDSMPFITSVDAGYRYNVSSSLNDEYSSNVGLRTLAESPTGDLFAGILTAGPDNFDAADGRDLFVKDFLVIDPEQVNSDPEGVLAVINAAIVANNAITGANRAPISSPTSTTTAYFDIEEKTNALYAQANFEHGIFRGDFGLRYLETDVNSTGNSVVNGSVTQATTKSSYDFLLPRLNVVANVREDVLVRAGWSKDIRRPDFNDLSTSASFSTSPNPPVVIGNPDLVPEEVTSWDLGVEWYFAPAAVVSVGYFQKDRTNLHVKTQEDPASAPGTGYRDTTAPCEGGGVFNPIADINVFGPTPGVGVCVPRQTTINGAGKTTQTGWEFAAQYDLSNFEDELGWASGFGIAANYTIQKFSGGDEYLTASGRSVDVFTALGATDVRLQYPLFDNSEDAYNITMYYEKYGLSARARYTWRSAYYTEDFGSTSSYPWSFPAIQEARGQLNASVNYDVTDNLALGLEAVNITESSVRQSCVNEGALLCFEGLTDRRVTFGVSYKY
ncbi:TonB-dependent receptor [Simiduia curdlanivorans]|uniref:TonB-dependent receptor n=1 Tax=Simiduia curdlanivorans TaxID=1492769 RepID=A0ABV8V561_9GAMM|nr:TonB-dependent receptor [Simiduia curdlanivorans]MDN3640748.1 TonB-dependent receptor [Simiduia curdlanivorans]